MKLFILVFVQLNIYPINLVTLSYKKKLFYFVFRGPPYMYKTNKS